MVANAIDTLTRKIRPPEHPVEARGNWREVEKNFGVRFPSDYKALIKIYGSGGFFGWWMWFFNPFSENKHINLYSAVAVTVKALKSHCKKSIAEDPDDEFARAVLEKLNSEAIFPCGVTANGDDLFWNTDGSPDRWGMTVLNFRDSERQEFRLSLTQFLVAIAKERLNCQLFPELTPPFFFKPAG